MLLLSWSGLAGAAKREMLLPRAESPALHYYHSATTTDQPTATATDDNDHDAIAR